MKKNREVYLSSILLFSNTILSPKKSKILNFNSRPSPNTHFFTPTQILRTSRQIDQFITYEIFSTLNFDLVDKIHNKIKNYQYYAIKKIRKIRHHERNRSYENDTKIILIFHLRIVQITCYLPTLDRRKQLRQSKKWKNETAILRIHRRSSFSQKYYYLTRFTSKKKTIPNGTRNVNVKANMKTHRLRTKKGKEGIKSAN